MASKAPIQCPICHEDMGPAEDLEDHLVENHPKRKLAKLIVAEEESEEEQNASE